MHRPPKRLLLIDQYFYPDSSAIAQLLTSLATGLADDKNYNVHICTSSSSYSGEIKQDIFNHQKQNELMNLTIHRAPLPPSFLTPIFKKKIAEHFWFYFYLFFFLAKNSLGKNKLFFDLFIVQSTPPLSILIVSFFAKIFSRPYFFICQDLFPNALQAQGQLSQKNIIYKILDFLLSKSYKNAHKNIVLSSQSFIAMREKGVAADKIEIIDNWAVGNIKTYPLIKPSPKLKILYSGNLGHGHEYETILQGIAQLKGTSRENIELTFMGHIKNKSGMDKIIRSLGISSQVKFKNFVPLSKLYEEFAPYHLGLLTIKPNWEGIIVPSKFYGLLAAGKPILCIGPSKDLEKKIHNYKIGKSFLNGDIEGVANFLKECLDHPEFLLQMGKKASDIYKNKYDRKLALKKYQSLIQKV